MVTLTIAPPCPMLLREAGSRRGRLQGTDGRMINRRTGSGKRARNPAGSRFKPGEPRRPARPRRQVSPDPTRRHRPTGGADPKAARRAGEVAETRADGAYADLAPIVAGLR